MVEVEPAETDGGARDAVAFFFDHGFDGCLVFLTEEGFVAGFLDEVDGVDFAVALGCGAEVGFEGGGVGGGGTEEDGLGFEGVGGLLEEEGD